MSRRLALFYVGPLVLWMAVIFAMSTDLGNSRTSSGLLVTALRHFAPTLLASFSPYQLERLDLIVRKLGHLTEYMVLTLLAVRALQFGRPALRWQSFFGALVLSVLYAMTDEVHQWFVPDRTASPRDVLIDVAGSVLCMAGILCWFGVKSVERRLWAAVRPGRAARPDPVGSRAPDR